MHITRTTLALIIGLLVSPVSVHAASASIAELSPSANVMAATNVSLRIVPTGFPGSVTYSLQDSFGGSTASSNNINLGGRFSWVPEKNDIGTHIFTFTVRGNEDVATVSQTITVLPPPSVAISTLVPGSTVGPNTTLTFTATTNGFANPAFTVGDTSSNPSIKPTDIDASGRFSWTPTYADLGHHTITVYASDTSGRSASQSVQVYVGKGATLGITLLAPSAAVQPGQQVTFTASPSEFSPTAFSVRDSFSGSTASNANINHTGQFAWSPASSDVGVHELTITGIVGAFGTSASTTQKITVLGPGGTLPLSASATSSTAGSGTTLAALQAKLATLQGSLVSAQTGSTNTGTSATLFMSYLKPGSSGDEVLRLQKVLAQLGYLSATPNGSYGPATTAAVQAFQKAKGLAALGVVGPSTRAALNALGASTGITKPVSTAASGTRFIFTHFTGVGDDDAEQVVELQKRLAELGYYAGSLTGYFGVETEAAVKRFQKAKGIPETGYVASITRAALNK